MFKHKMISYCPTCTSPNKIVRLQYSNGDLICPNCEYVYPTKVIEQDGLILSKGSLEYIIATGTRLNLRLQDYKDLNNIKFRTIKEENLPQDNSIKEYKLTINYEVKVYYENA